MICWNDDFCDEFTPGPNARWSYLAVESYVADDGIASTSKDGLRVVSSGTNPRTGKPAFVRTLGQDDGSGSGVSGAQERVKWLVFANHQASTGYQGFDAVPGQELICETWMSGCTYGTNDHPFGRHVINPDGDPRLATVGMSAIDPETDTLFEFAFTNEQVYVFYERLPWLRASLGNYAAFLYTIPVASRSPGDRHHFEISYDRAAGVVRWLLDGKEVYRVDRLGYLLPSREYMMLDHGGVENLVEPRQLNCGMGMFSILDGALPGHFSSGLVRLSGADSFYFDPATGVPNPQNFLDNKSLESNRLFGQGAEFSMSRYVVSSVPARSS
ncbi:MAG: DUF6081 family protein [Pseudonocardiaceae bacterium]